VCPSACACVCVTSLAGRYDPVEVAADQSDPDTASWYVVWSQRAQPQRVSDRLKRRQTTTQLHAPDTASVDGRLRPIGSAVSAQLIRHGTGSLGHRVNGSFGSSFTSGSPGHHFDPV